VNEAICAARNRLTWTDGVAPPPLVSVSGVIESPYRGLGDSGHAKIPVDGHDGSRPADS